MTDWNPSRSPRGRFMPGSGGRPRNARNRSGRVLREAFEKSMESHLADAIEEVRQDDPHAYLRLLMKVVPSPGYDEVEPQEAMTSEELEQRLHKYAFDLAASGYGPWPVNRPPGAAGKAGQPGDPRADRADEVPAQSSPAEQQNRPEDADVGTG